MHELLVALLTTLGVPALVLVHELGHALACVALGGRVERLRVGGEPQLTIGRGAFSLELSLRQDGSGDGFVEQLLPLSPWRVAAVSLAGPAAHLLFVVACVLLAPVAAGAVEVGLWVLAAIGAISLVYNLLPLEGHDGRTALDALRGVVTPVEEDVTAELPHSIGPPQPAGPAMRWPFAVLLGVVVGLTLILGMPLMTLTLAVLFAGAYLRQA